MLVVRFDTALYLRTYWRNGKKDKVVRLRVNDGAVDFISEHLIPTATTRAATGSAYGNSTDILRNGSDEAPPALIDGDWHGGNHSGLSHYRLGIFLDGRTLAAPRFTKVGTLLTLREEYMIPTDAAIAAGQPDPVRAFVRIERRFSNDGFCRYTYAITAVQQLVLEQLTTMQIFKPVVKAGQSLVLVVPSSNLSNGVNITSEAQDRFLPPEDWDTPNPPAHFIKEIRVSSTPQWAISMGFTGQIDRGTLTSACFRSAAGKFYPRAFEGPVTMMPGERRSFSGFFGSYNRL